MKIGVMAVAWSCLLLLLLLPAANVRGQDCVLNGNPSCSSAVNLGTIAGDSGQALITRSGTGEAFFSVRIQETSSSSRPLTVRVHLATPAGVDYDLVLRCVACSGAAMPLTKAGPGATESAAVTRSDTWVDNSFTLVIEVRHYSGTSCAPWTLSINGNATPVAGALICG